MARGDHKVNPFQYGQFAAPPPRNSILILVANSHLRIRAKKIPQGVRQVESELEAQWALHRRGWRVYFERALL